MPQHFHTDWQLCLHQEEDSKEIGEGLHYIYEDVVCRLNESESDHQQDTTSTRSVRSTTLSTQSAQTSRALVGPGMIHSSSMTWVSAQSREMERWHSIKSNLERYFPRSELIHWTPSDYLQQRSAMTSAQAERVDRIVQDSIETKILRRRNIPGDPPIPTKYPHPCHSKFFPPIRQNMAAVHGGDYTIWCHEIATSDEYRAPWPRFEELKWEGPDRANTNNGRFLPLPRDHRNNTVAWHLRPQVHEYPIDKVWAIPTMMDVYAPTDEIEDRDIPKLLNSDIFDAAHSDDIM